MKKIQFFFILGLTVVLLACTTGNREQKTHSVQYYLEMLKAQVNKYGAPVAGSESEYETAKLIEREFLRLGISTKTQTFRIKNSKENIASRNIIAEIDNGSNKTLIIGGHYDAVQVENSYGAIDNLSSVALLLSLAKHAKASQKLKYNLKFIAFGAEEISLPDSEEIGLFGSRHYVNELTQKELKQLDGMINLDSIAGGDKLYIHSAHTTPYPCKSINKINYSSDNSLRDSLINKSRKILGNDSHSLHKGYTDLPSGETANWSDHSSFACVGLPIAYFEATNFDIVGENGNDGYSQTINSQFWDCFDSTNQTACDRQKENKWGYLWHSKHDRFDTVEQAFQGRIANQLQNHYFVLTSFFEGTN